MQTTSSILRQNKFYFTGLVAVLVLTSFFLLLNGKAAAYISVNSYHPFLLNVFFINYTFLGDGVFALCLTAATFFYYKRKQQGRALLLSFLISGITVQIIKNLANSGLNLFFEAGQYLHPIDGIGFATGSSLPSGHTATAFAIATVIVLMMKDKNWQLLILVAAMLVGYSRIYLAQHFLLDVQIGAIIGSASGVLSVYLAKNIKGIKLSIKKMHRLSDSSSTSAIQPV